MSTAPKISVILPVRDGEEYLVAALESVVSQDGPTFETIVIDDGSTDSTPAILQDFAGKGITVLRLEGGGLVSALNAGLACAQGEYIARMDADDICLPGRFAAQAAVLDQDFGTSLVYGAVRIIDDVGRAGHTIAAQPLDAAERHSQLTDAISARPIIHPTVMMRRDALDQVDGYRNAPCAEDHDLWLRTVDDWKFTALPQLVLHYRQHSAGVSRARAFESRISHLINCVCDRHRRATGIDLYCDRPERYAAIRSEVVAAVGRRVEDLVQVRKFREAVRAGKVRDAVRSAPRCLLHQPGLLNPENERVQMRAMQAELFAKLTLT
ncbi:glycosyltransferase family 2 protein [Altererythrobacter aquiaggeris]|uniref:glycosyltransferase family 2 protein n=1 Tax=Aestuarierythrobacter aquiaggeris TaxID=1898396 RepID=UPI00301843A2